MPWNAWSLDFEVVYHFRYPGYILHMDAQQDIFLDIYRRFQQEGIQFAHPLSFVRLGEPVGGRHSRGSAGGCDAVGAIVSLQILNIGYCRTVTDSSYNAFMHHPIPDLMHGA